MSLSHAHTPARAYAFARPHLGSLAGLSSITGPSSCRGGGGGWCGEAGDSAWLRLCLLRALVRHPPPTLVHPNRLIRAAAGARPSPGISAARGSPHPSQHPSQRASQQPRVPWVEDDLQPLNHGDPEDDDSALDLGDPLAGDGENTAPAPAGKRQYLMLNDVCGLVPCVGPAPHPSLSMKPVCCSNLWASRNSTFPNWTDVYAHLLRAAAGVGDGGRAPLCTAVPVAPSVPGGVVAAAAPKVPLAPASAPRVPSTGTTRLGRNQRFVWPSRGSTLTPRSCNRSSRSNVLGW